MIVAIYARFSSVADLEKTSSIEAQIQMCKQKAVEDGWVVDENHIYIDRAVSGSTINRPAFQQMLNAIESNYFPNILITKDTSRLFRNEREAGHYESWIWSQGVEIHYVIGQSGNPNLDDNVWFSGRIGHLVAEFYRRKTAKVTFAHQEMNAKAGYSNGGSAPFGYLRREVFVTDESGMEKRKVIYRLDPDTAPAIKMAFELYLAGRGGKHIADVLTSHGFRSRNDKPISKSSILNWFRVPFVYAGCRVWNVSHWQKNDAGKKVNRIFHPREEWVIIPDSHPAIIKMEDAEQAYQNMQKNNLNNHQRRMGQRAKYLLAGLANCEHCGHNLQMKYNRRNGEAYYCCGYRRLSQANCDNRRHYNQDLIEDTVMEMIDEYLLQEGYIENQLHQQLELVEKQKQESKAEIEPLTAEKQEIEARIDTSLELLVDGRVPKERVIIKMQQDEQRLRDLQDKIIKVEEIKAPTAEDLEVFRNQLRMQVEGELDMDTKKSVLNSIVKKMGVNQDGLVEIDFCVALGNTPYGS